MCLDRRAGQHDGAAPAPIVLFVYNRPEHTRRTVEALRACILANESELIIFSDGAKSETQRPAVNDVRQYIQKIEGFKSVTIVERESNYGLARSVVDGVTSVVNKFGRIIVLEDDLVVTPAFLGFMNTALDRYENERNVVQISGYMFPVTAKVGEDALFLPLTTSWGWATWQRAWKLFDPEAKGYAQVKKDRALRKRFNLDGAYDYFSMLEWQLAGRIDSWAVRWQLSAFLAGGLTLYPRRSLVINAGFDGSGTHGVTQAFPGSDASDEFVPGRLPEVIAVGATWKEVCDLLRAPWYIRIRRWLRSLWPAWPR